MVIEIYRQRWLKYLNAKALTIFPFIFYYDKKIEVPETLRRHEWEHIKQYKDLWFFKFFYVYISDYIRNRMKGMDHDFAYLHISLEKEAYKKQNDGQRPWE